MVPAFSDYKSLRWAVSFNLFICQPIFQECCKTVTEESSMQILCDIAGLHPRMPVRRHLIGAEWVKTPIEEETQEEELLTFISLRQLWAWGGSRGDISSSASWSPVVVTICSLLLPDFFLESPCRCLWSKSHWGGGREGPSWLWIGFERAWELWCVNSRFSFWEGGEKSDLNFSGSPRMVPFKNCTIRNSTCLNDSPDGAEKSGWNLSIKLIISGVYTSDRWQPSQCPWLISRSASEDCICSSPKFISCTGWCAEISIKRIQDAK